jgi:hypothetical protein
LTEAQKKAQARDLALRNRQMNRPKVIRFWTPFQVLNRYSYYRLCVLSSSA